jgi:hypothetical protein
LQEKNAQKIKKNHILNLLKTFAAIQFESFRQKKQDI